MNNVFYFNIVMAIAVMMLFASFTNGAVSVMTQLVCVLCAGINFISLIDNANPTE